MLVIAIIAVLLQGAPVKADPRCSRLSEFVGTYHLSETNCPHSFANDFEVEFDVNAYFLEEGGVFVGIGTGSGTKDTCTFSGQRLIVKTCMQTSTCLPQRWVYEFSDQQLVFYKRDSCRAQYLKD